MNQQYLMNKEVSVQYAYKKDGKGERHGDEAERMLATQARKHNVQPSAQPLPANLFQPAPMSAMPAMPAMPSGNYGNVPNGNYQQYPPSRAPNQQPLPAPPSDLPARPPRSQAGYGGPSNMMPQQYNNGPLMGGFHQGQPPGFGPPGFGGAPPQGFGAPPGFGGPPMGMPPGFAPQGYPQQQQQGYGGR